MKRAPLTYRLPRRSKECITRMREVERDFHVRAFGEELASVNLDMTIQERHSYLEWMREACRQHGIRPAPRHWEALEAKILRELEKEERNP